MGKKVTITIKKDVVQAAGYNCKKQVLIPVVNNIVDLLECDKFASIVQIDATNVFINLKRNVFFHNIKIICPEIVKLVSNCYTSPSRLFIRGGSEIKWQGGATQGDPITMGLYAFGISPLQSKVISSNRGSTSTDLFYQIV